MNPTDFFSEFAECPSVENLSFSYCSGDDRSYGSLQVDFKLGGRFLEFKFDVGSCGGVEDVRGEGPLTVDGKPVELDDWPDVEVPHHDAGLKTCDRWEKRADETLVVDFQEWVEAQWKAAKGKGKDN